MNAGAGPTRRPPGKSGACPAPWHPLATAEETFLMRLPRFLLPTLLFLSAARALVAAAPVPIELAAAGTHELELKESSPGTYDVLTTGTDPYLLSRSLPAGIDDTKTFVL